MREGVQLLTLIALLVYGWIIHSVGWGRLVRTNWGLGNLGLINDAIVFLPFLLIQLLIWWGQFLRGSRVPGPRRAGVAGAAGSLPDA